MWLEKKKKQRDCRFESFSFKREKQQQQQAAFGASIVFQKKGTVKLLKQKPSVEQ